MLKITALVPLLLSGVPMLSPPLDAAPGPNVTAVSYDGLTHSAVRLNVASRDWSGGQQGSILRIRYAVSPETCTGGTGGMLQGNQAILQSSFTQVVLAGLRAGTAYQACPELSNDGAHWSKEGAAATFTTLALPAIHPAPPIAPASFKTDYPDTSAYTSVKVASDCSDFLSQYAIAVKAQKKHGTVINIPAGAVCGSGSGYPLAYPLGAGLIAADAVVFTGDPSHVNTSTSTITTNSAHGFAEGQAIRFGSNYGCVPGSVSPSKGFCHYQGAIIIGQVYYAHVVSSTAFQVYSGASRANGGKLIELADAGNGNNFVVGLNADSTRMSDHQIIIRTATPDAQFAPEYTRVNPAWVPKMATFRMPNSLRGVGKSFLTIDDLNVNAMAYGIRFVGIEFAYEADPLAKTSADPIPWDTITSVASTAQNIVFDRCIWHANGTPERIYRALSWDGMNSAIVDSYIDNWEFFHSAFTGLELKKTSGTSFTISSGSHYFGAGHGSLSGRATVTISGTETGSGTHWAPIYFSMAGNQLNIILPPGLSGTCAGVSNCVVRATTTEKTSVAAAGSSGTFPGASKGEDYYFVDPIFSRSPDGSNATSLFPKLTTPLSSGAGSGAAYQLGFRFSSSVAGYIPGIRFYRHPGDTAPKHTVYLWDDSGKLLGTATTAKETPSGWQSASFASPIAIAPGSVYIASWQTSYFYYSTAFWRNSSYSNGPLSAVSTWKASNESHDQNDMWPPDSAGRPAAGYVGYALINGGAIASVANLGGNGTGSTFATEGCQCMTGGKGPGPYVFRDNYVSAVGLPWHHDDAGLNFTTVGDYTYVRNTFHTPFSRMWQSATSNGMRYFNRQPLEWKKGVRIYLDGDIMDGSWVEDNPASCMICMTARLSNEGIRDVSVTNTTFQHGPGLMALPGQADTGAQNESTVGGRFLFRNNLAWDIQERYCIASGASCPGQANGWIFEGPTGGEDYRIDHNTFAGNTGRVSSVFHLFDTKIEGVSVTNNVLHLGGNLGISYDGGIGAGIDPCASGVANGGPMANCKFTPPFVWDHNLMIGNGVSDSQLKSNWSKEKNNNYFPPDTVRNVLEWSSSEATAPSDTPSRFHLKSKYTSASGFPASDGKDVGYDRDQLEAAQGKVGPPSVVPASTTAAVSFIAPDSFGCPVDWSTSDSTLISSFTRVADRGGSRARKITLSGLPAHSEVYYRVDCSVQQPQGIFKTN